MPHASHFQLKEKFDHLLGYKLRKSSRMVWFNFFSNIYIYIEVLMLIAHIKFGRDYILVILLHGQESHP